MSTTFRGPQLTDEQKQTLGGSLKELRQSLSLTLDAVAASAGLTKAAIHQYETGASVPTLGAVVAIAAALRVRPSAIVAALDPPKKTFRKSPIIV